MKGVIFEEPDGDIVALIKPRGTAVSAIVDWLERESTYIMNVMFAKM